MKVCTIGTGLISNGYRDTNEELLKNTLYTDFQGSLVPYKIAEHLDVMKDSVLFKEIFEKNGQFGGGFNELLDYKLTFVKQREDRYSVFGLVVDKPRIPKETYNAYDIYSIMRSWEYQQGEGFTDYYESLFDEKFIEWLEKNTIFNPKLYDEDYISVPDIVGYSGTFPLLNLDIEYEEYRALGKKGDLTVFLDFKILELYANYITSTIELTKHFTDEVLIKNNSDTDSDTFKKIVDGGLYEEYRQLPKISLEEARECVLKGIPIECLGQHNIEYRKK